MEASFLWRNFYAPPNALLYLSTFEATKKWTMPVQNWGKVYGELANYVRWPIAKITRKSQLCQW